MLSQHKLIIQYFIQRSASKFLLEGVFVLWFSLDFKLWQVVNGYFFSFMQCHLQKIKPMILITDKSIYNIPPEKKSNASPAAEPGVLF